MDKKVCSTYNEEKLKSEFSQRISGKIHGVCKSCHNKYNKKHYQKNKDLYISRAATRTVKLREIQREFIIQIKSVPCKDCGIKYPPYVMQFDHLLDKEFTISDCIGQVGLDRLKKEIEKCDIVCSNCHAERTHQRKHLGVR